MTNEVYTDYENESYNRDQRRNVNAIIGTLPGEYRNQISDGYHTFGELYDHRIELYITLCRLSAEMEYLGYGVMPWRSKAHSDGSVWDGWFIMGIHRQPGKQITYHLPMSYWDRTSFCRTEDKAPEWDGHTSEDVLERLKIL